MSAEKSSYRVVDGNLDKKTQFHQLACLPYSFLYWLFDYDFLYCRFFVTSSKVALIFGRSYLRFLNVAHLGEYAIVMAYPSDS